MFLFLHFIKHANAIYRDRQKVTFILGPEGATKSFTVSKSIATSKSEPFRAAFTGNFSEARTLTMRIDDVLPEHFEILVRFLKNNFNDGIHYDLIQLPKLWELGDRYILPDFQNAVTAMLYETLNCQSNYSIDTWRSKENKECMSPAFLEAVYSIPSENSLFKKLAVDYLAWIATPADAERCIEEGPIELGRDIAMTMKNAHLEFLTGQRGVPGIYFSGVEKYYVK